MEIQYVLHARLRMERYGLSEETIESVIRSPDSILDGHSGRKIFQQRINGHVLRVIVEDDAEIKRVVTVYISRSSRYEV